MGLLGLLFAYVYCWFRAIKVTLYPDRVAYRSLSRRERHVTYCDITALTVSIGLNQRRREGFYQLQIHSVNDNKPLVINIKPFSRQDLAMLVTVISRQNPSVQLDDYSAQLLAGNIRSISATGAKRLAQRQITHAIIYILGFVLLGTLIKTIVHP